MRTTDVRHRFIVADWWWIDHENIVALPEAVSYIRRGHETRLSGSGTASVLLVHADADQREMYALYLRNDGFEVQEAETIDAALWQIPETKAVITGLMVPGSVDPLEFIRAVRRHSTTTPILVLTACAVPARIETAQAVGADVVLVKPCLPDKLVQELRALMARKRQRSQLDAPAG